jgi:hypothetical protein
VYKMARNSKRKRYENSNDLTVESGKIKWKLEVGRDSFFQARVGLWLYTSGYGFCRIENFTKIRIKSDKGLSFTK